MIKLRPVPDSPPKAVLYLRQSVSHDDSVSLALQETAGRDYCQRMGYLVAGVEADPGITGRTWKRPAVQRVMQMVDDGAADVIVLWRWSRLSRSRRDWAVAADRADMAGGRIESSTETVDVATATGRLARGVLVEFAAFESDRIGEVWKEVHASRLAQGRTPNGKPRFGYVWNLVEKIHEPDPVTGPALRRAYERYVAGASVYSLVRWLNAERVWTTAGNPWTDHALRRVLDSGFAAGLIRWRNDSHPGVHEVLIGADVWQAYLDARVVRRAVPANVKRSRYVLSGLVRCGRCEGPMVANSGSGQRKTSMRCSTSKERGREACVGGYVEMSVVVDAVLAWLGEEAAAEGVDAVAAHESKTLDRAAESVGDLRRLSRRIVEIDRALTKLAKQNAEDLIGDVELRAARGEYLQERAGLEERVEELGRADRRHVSDRPAMVAGLLADWDVLPVEVRRATLGNLIQRVVVWTGDRSGVRGVAGGASNARVEVVPT